MTSAEVVHTVGGLEIKLRAKPILGAQGWGFELRIGVRNTLEAGIFDIGPAPRLELWVSIADLKGGRGGGRRCARTRLPAGQLVRALGPGEHEESELVWDRGADAGERLAAVVTVCPIRLPDGSSVSPELANISMIVGPDTQLEVFELSPADPS
ncbi:hypothetical protein ENSA5_12650 [Enhygromyxa salina]|uniref:Uncharacterized protein n=1 Tax=Enhygromyxa salina TaxID=215803 RepID=A0A2S9YFA1_9BACT|nr:hypothetical protein [Enhygromyxa salina]PRQ03759.1 hypothetical protein ENSA5_12650 [Enhygromyxa salina]